MMIDLHAIALECFEDYGSSSSSSVSIADADVEATQDGDDILAGCTVHICVWGNAHDDIDLSGDNIDAFCERTDLVLQGITLHVSIEGTVLYLHANIAFVEPDREDADEVGLEIVAPATERELAMPEVGGDLERELSDQIEEETPPEDV